MNERIKLLAEQSGGEFWQRIESDGVLNKEAYITFDPPQSLEKFAELIVRECMNTIAESREVRQTAYYYRNRIAKHFGDEE